MSGERSLAARPTSTLTRSSDVTAATTAQRADPQQLERRPVLAAPDRDRNAGGARQPQARRRGIALGGEHRNAPLQQALPQPETDLTEPHQQHVAPGRSGSCAQQRCQPGPAEPADERSGEDGDQQQRSDGIERRDQLEPGGLAAAPGSAATVATDRGAEVQRVGGVLVERHHRTDGLDRQRRHQAGAGSDQEPQSVVDEPDTAAQATDRLSSASTHCRASSPATSSAGERTLTAGNSVPQLARDRGVEHRRPDREVRTQVRAQQREPQRQDVITGEHHHRRAMNRA